jgi:hypothetical protein
MYIVCSLDLKVSPCTEHSYRKKCPFRVNARLWEESSGRDLVTDSASDVTEPSA